MARNNDLAIKREDGTDTALGQSEETRHHTHTQQTARYLIQRVILIPSYVIGKAMNETHPSLTRHLLAVFAHIFILASNILRDSHRLGMSSIPLPNAEPMRGKRQTDPILQRHPSPILQPQANTQQ